jgi:hypothetical protein
MRGYCTGRMKGKEEVERKNEGKERSIKEVIRGRRK